MNPTLEASSSFFQPRKEKEYYIQAYYDQD